jgi:toxin YhaV
MSQASPASLVVNGWTLFAHPLFLDQIEQLTQQVEVLRQKDATGFVKKNAAKRLAAIARLAFEVIPQDPARAEYRQGSTLGEEHKHWFRVKFFQQYRLFFRNHAQTKIIVFAATRPPDNWELLLAEAQAASARLRKIGASL